MEDTEIYRYLGINQNIKIDHTKLKDDFMEIYNKRLETVLKTKLNSINLIRAINSWVVGSLSYTYGLLKWSQTDLEALDRQTRTTMTKYRMHHPRACTERLYLPRRKGGRGLLNIQKLHNSQVTKLQKYFNRSDLNIHSIITSHNFEYTALKETYEERFSDNTRFVNQAIESWKNKSLHGKYPQLIDEVHINKEKSIAYLRRGELYPETEGFITAIQDSVIATKNHQKYIFKSISDDKCRLCKEKSETIEHVIGSCSILANTEYLNRHNQVAKIIYSQLAVQNKILQHVEPYYKFNPEPVIENNNFKMLWDRQIITDKTIDHNKPDIVLQNKSTDETFLIEIGVPLSHNLSRVYMEKSRKYKNVEIELKRIWKQKKVTTIVLLVSATGVIDKTLQPNLEQLNIHPSIINMIQKAVILQTCNITRKFLNYQQ
jgi:hypothetical protein